MIEEILTAKNLTRAYQKVYANKGSAGVDGMEVHDLKSWIDTNRNLIISGILDGSYRVSPIKAVEIPKHNGNIRVLGVPTAIDRWLQQAVSQRLQLHFEEDFEDSSYGFRPWRNAHQALEKSLEYINDGYQDIVDIDLKSFFDEVAHHHVLELIYAKVKCRTTLWLLRKWLRAPIEKSGRLHKRRKGLPQGSPLSPLLSNIMLDVLDKEASRRGWRYVRYADDFSLYTKTKAEARHVGNEVYRFLRDKLRLPINQAKSGLRRPSTFVMLGHEFVPTYRKGDKGKYQMVVSKKSWQNLKRKLKRLTKKTLPYKFRDRLSKIRTVWQGWINYYRLASIYTKLKALDEWLRNRLRYCIWHDWKRPDRKRKNLIRLGVEKGQAYAWSRTRMGGWAVAQSPILKTTITRSRLRRVGYRSMLSYYQKFQPSLR